MKQKLLIVLALFLLVLLLAGLNAATYVQKEKIADTEFAPNRSTYNSGSTGVQAFFTLLSETGRNVTRWQASLKDLDFKSNSPARFSTDRLRGVVIALETDRRREPRRLNRIHPV